MIVQKTLMFGSTGAIGSAIFKRIAEQKKFVVCMVRDIKEEDTELVKYELIENKNNSFNFNALTKYGSFDNVIWAHGMNCNDSIYDFDAENCLKMFEVNCLYILSCLAEILKLNLLDEGARLVIISSIWQNIARQNKLSYCVSKSAIQGLVNSLSVDLAPNKHLINAILPGALDTEMTRNNLSEHQLLKLKSSTLFDDLPKLEDVVEMAMFLSSTNNKSITGQFISVDLGFSNAHIV